MGKSADGLLWYVALLLVTLGSGSAAPQTKQERGVTYPKDFRTDRNETSSRVGKTSSDTLQYKPLQIIKGEFAVNSGCGTYGTDQHQINIASDTAGNFLCVWIDERTGLRQVDAQLFDHDGPRHGAVIHVSERYNQWNSDPHVVYNRVSGEYVVLWAETGYDIRLQRITTSGEPVGRNLTVNQMFLTNTNNPSAAVDSSGNIILTWYSDQTCCSNALPYCRVLDKTGIPITDQWCLVNPATDHISSIGWDDRIAADSSGRSVIVWSTFVSQRSRIALQVANRTGNLLSGSVIASDPADTCAHVFPTVAGTRDGHFLIVWGCDHGVEGRIYQIDSGFVSPQFAIDDVPESWKTYGVSSDDRATFYVVCAGAGRYGRIISAQGGTVGAKTPLSFPTTIRWWSYPRLSKGLFSRLNLVYGGSDRTQLDVMLQSFDLAFHPVGPSVKVADDDCTAWQTNPTVKYNQSGKSLVVWEDQRNGYHDLYGQVLDESSNPVAENFAINDTGLVQWPANTTIVPDHNGDFVVCFSGGEYSNRNIIMQRVTASGTRVGTNKKITNDYSYYGAQKSVLVENDRGDFLLCWYTGSSSTYPVISQKLRSDFSPAIEPVVVFNGNPSLARKVVCVGSNNLFDILVVWLDGADQTHQSMNVLNAMILDAQGRAVSDTMRLESLSGNAEYTMATCKIDNDRNIAVLAFDGGLMRVLRRYATEGIVRKNAVELNVDWPVHQIVRFEGRKLFAIWNSSQYVNGIFFDDNSLTLTPMRLQEITPIPSYIHYSTYSADISGNKIQIGYEAVRDPRNGFDVYINTQLLTQTNFDYVPSDYERITAVYPNPTSGVVSFEYELVAPHPVTIAVYNIIGQKVLDIEAGPRDAGNHGVRFDTRGLSSGVYFIRYMGIRSYGQKLLVVK